MYSQTVITINFKRNYNQAESGYNNIGPINYQSSAVPVQSWNNNSSRQSLQRAIEDDRITCKL